MPDLRPTRVYLKSVATSRVLINTPAAVVSQCYYDTSYFPFYVEVERIVFDCDRC